MQSVAPAALSPNQLSRSDRGISPTVREGSDRSRQTSGQLVSIALLLARQLSTDLANKEQIETLITQIEDARRALRTESKQSHPRNAASNGNAVSNGNAGISNGVLDELQAALDHAHTALTMTGSTAGGFESAKLRLGWAAARLKRANEQLRQE